MTKIFKVPFADTGDKISPPDAIQPDGSVSYGLGYGFDYQRDTSLDSGGAPVDPLAKVFPREQHNGILNDITVAIGEAQHNGLTIWQTSGAPYPINAMVRFSEKNWRSLVSNNNATPSEGEFWTETSSRFVFLGGSIPVRITAGTGGGAGNIYAMIGSVDAGNLWTSSNFSPSTKITGENCPQAGFTAGGTLPYMKKLDGSVVNLLSKSNPSMEGNATAPTYSPGTADTRIATTAFVEERVSRVPKNTAFMGEDGWWKCGDTGLIRQRRKVFVGDLAGNTTKIDVVWPVTYPNQCSSVLVTFMSEAAATSNPRVSAQYVVAAKSTYSCLVAFHEWVSEVQSPDLYILVESEGY